MRCSVLTGHSRSAPSLPGRPNDQRRVQCRSDVLGDLQCNHGNTHVVSCPGWDAVNVMSVTDGGNTYTKDGQRTSTVARDLLVHVAVSLFWRDGREYGDHYLHHVG